MSQMQLRGVAVVGPLESAGKSADWPYAFRCVVKAARWVGVAGGGGGSGEEMNALREIRAVLDLPESALRRNAWYGWHLLITDGKRARARQLGAEEVEEGRLRVDRKEGIEGSGDRGIEGRAGGGGLWGDEDRWMR